MPILIGLGPILRFYTLSAPPVQYRFDVFFYILDLWANDFKTLTKNKVSESHITELFLTWPLVQIRLCQFHYQNGQYTLLLLSTGHTINIEARNMVYVMHRCNPTKNNILASKGAWPGSRDLLFKCRDPFRNFSTGEARHFVFSLLDRSRWVLSDGWWMTPKGTWSGSRDVT